MLTVGCVATDQAVPFQRSIIGRVDGAPLVYPQPTAHADVVLCASIPVMWFDPALGFGVATTAQVAANAGPPGTAAASATAARITVVRRTFR